MRIDRLDLKAYGGFTDRSLDLSGGPHRFHLVVGDNETGKSTALRAITALLYGFEHLTDDAYLHPAGSLRVGARLVGGDGGAVEVVRKKGRKRTLLTPDEADEVAESVMTALIGGVSRSDFSTRFGLSHDELVRGGRSIVDGQGDLGEILFAAGAGVGQLRTIRAAYEESSRQLFKSAGSLPTINAAIAEMKTRRAEVRDASVTPRRYDDLRRELEAQRHTATSLSGQMGELRTRIGRLAAVEKSLPLVPVWRSAVAAVAASGGTVLLDDDFSRRRREVAGQLAVAQSTREETRGRIEQLRQRIDQHPVDEAVAAAENEIELLAAKKGAIEKEITDRQNLTTSRSRALRRLATTLENLSLPVPETDAESWIEQIDAAADGVKISDNNRTRLSELARQHPLLVDARDRAETDKNRLTQRIETVAGQLQSLPLVDAPEELAAAVTAAGNVADRLAHHQLIVDQSAASANRCREILQRLPGLPPGPNPSDVAKRALPAAGEIERAEAALASAQRRVETNAASVAQMRHDAEQLDEQRRSIDIDGNLPTEAELLAVRRSRDELIGELPADRWEARRAEVVRAIIDADLMVDTLRTQREKVMRIESLDRGRRRLDDQIGKAVDDAKTFQTDVADAQTAWTDLWHAAGIAAGSPESMRAWPAEHRALVTAVGDAVAAQQRVAASDQKIQASIDRLRTAIGSPKELAGETSLAVVMRLAEAELKRVGDAVRTREKLVADRHELTGQAEAAEQTSRQAAEALEHWHRNWDAIAAAVGGQSMQPAEVSERIRVVTELLAQLKETHILFGRIRSMTDDQVGFARQVARMVRSIGAEASAIQDDSASLDDQTAAAMLALQQSVTRLRREQSAAQTRRQLNDDLAAANAQLMSAESLVRRHEATLTTFCGEANCQSPDQLPGLERAAEKRRDELRRLTEVEQQLQLLAGQEALTSFVDSLDGVTAGTVQVDRIAAQTELDAIAGQHGDAHQKLGALQSEFNKIDGSAAASVAAQALQLTAGSLARDVRAYAGHRAAMMILNRAMEHYRGENQSPVLELAREAMTTLTGGRYVSLRPDEDDRGRTVLYAVPAEGGEVPAYLLSTGTADALYLSLRIASLRHQMSAGVTLPLIVDDCLVQLDDDRSIAAMGLFSDLSQQTQVIMFTHHRHLAKLAERHLGPGAVHIHDLIEVPTPAGALF